MTSISVRTPTSGGSEDFAQVEITLDGGKTVAFTIHQSKAYANTVNVEIDGDLTNNDPALRINLNDNLIFDSTQVPTVVDDREPTLKDPDSERDH